MISTITFDATSRFITGFIFSISSSANRRSSGGGVSRLVLFMIEIA